MFLEMQCTTEEQANESIRRKDIGWDPQGSVVLQAAIFGCHVSNSDQMCQGTCSGGITC